MSQNKILRAGMLVRYAGMNPDLGRLAFASGQTYEVKLRDGSLIVQAGSGMQVALVNVRGELTDWTDSFVMVKCPLVLPRGI